MPTLDLTGSAIPTVAEVLTKLGADPKTGLSPADLQERLNKYGPNALAEKKKSQLSAFLAYFRGPIPWMIEAAALISEVPATGPGKPLDEEQTKVLAAGLNQATHTFNAMSTAPAVGVNAGVTSW